ncbi:MAG: hypothetical protein L0Z62_50810 [Gemmataceae bacterium]|nr:hypothetical protein [Gemmataceae bacterium]
MLSTTVLIGLLAVVPPRSNDWSSRSSAGGNLAAAVADRPDRGIQPTAGAPGALVAKAKANQAVKTKRVMVAVFGMT